MAADDPAPSRRPKILFYIWSMPVGGAERHTLDLRRRLIARGYAVDLLVHARNLSQTMMTAPGSEGAVYIRRRGMTDPVGWWLAGQAIRKSSADVVFCVNQTPMVFAGVVKALGGTRAKLACIFHTTIMNRHDRLRLPLFRAALSAADRLIYVSENQRRYWRGRALARRKDVTIHNGVDLDRFKPPTIMPADAKRALGLSAEDFVVGLLAAMRPEKNHGLLLKAISALRESGVPATALLVGDGPMRSQIEREARSLGVLPFVHFAGEQGDVRPYIAAFDVGVICSNAVETFSLAALELLASGVPMVMSDIGGASEQIVEGVNGALFSSDDLDGLIAGLKFASDPTRLRAMRSQARGSTERYRIEGMVDAYARVADELGAPRR